MQTKTYWMATLAAASIMAGLCPSPAWGQFGTRRANDLDPQQLMAAQFAVFTHTALLGQGEPTADQLTRARTLLDFALELDPDQPELLRIRGELATYEGDTEGKLNALRRYLKLRPSDDAAQLQLILTLTAREQTLDGRLDSMERILKSAGGQRLSRPLRSRLALYAAVAARELGDETAFGAWLQQAVELDPANPEAAQLTYELAVLRGADMLQLGIAAIARARAKPLDINARLDLGQILLSQAAYYQAAEQFDTMATLLSAPPDEEQLRAWVLSLAAASRASDALRMLGNYEAYLASQRDPAAQTDNEVDPILPTELELLRLAVLASANDDLLKADADASYALLKQSLLDRQNAGEPNAQADYAWVSALFGRELDEVELTLRELPAEDPLVQRARGWLAIQKRDPEEARAVLTDLAKDDPWAKLGMARLLEVTDDNQRIALQSLVFETPNSLVGMLAARELTATRRDVRPTQTGALLVRQMERYPDQLWRADVRSAPWVDMNIDVEPKRFSYLQKIPARVSIKNLCGVSLALGPGGTLPGTVLLTLSPSIAGQRSAPLPQIVLDLNRQLTLRAGESIEVPLRIDESVFGMVARLHPQNAVGVRVSGLLDPVAAPDGRVTGGLLSIRDTLQGILIPGLPPTEQNIDDWIDQINTAEGAPQMLALAKLVQLPGTELEPLNDVLRARRLSDAVNNLYPELDPLRQAWTVMFITPQAREDGALSRVMDLAQRSTEPMVQIALLTTQVDDPASPVLAAALRSDNKLVRDYAAAIRDALQRAAEAAAGTAAPQ